MQANSYRTSLYILFTCVAHMQVAWPGPSLRAATALLWQLTQSCQSCCVLVDSYSLLDPHCSTLSLQPVFADLAFHAVLLFDNDHTILHTVPSRWIQNLTVCLPGSSNSWIYGRSLSYWFMDHDGGTCVHIHFNRDMSAGFLELCDHK